MNKSIKLNLIILLSLFFAANISGFAQGWEELKSLDNPNRFAVLTSSNGNIYLVSGTQGGPAATYEYNPQENKWTTKAPIPQGCIWTTANAVNGKIYVMGGGQSNTKMSLHYIYDVDSDSWSQGPSLLTPRMYHSSAVVNDKIYIIGGQNGDGTTEWQFDQYDPALNTWFSKAQTPHNEAWYCGAAAIGNTFYRISGGRWNAPTDWFDSYDTQTNSWTPLPQLNFKVHAPVAVAYAGNIYLIGGYINSNKSDTTFLYSPASGSWAPMLNRLPEPMAYHKACVLDNYIYLFNVSEDGTEGKLWRFKVGLSDIEDSEISSEKITVSPSPSSESFELVSDIITAKSSIEIYDMLGKKIAFRTVDNQDKKCNIEMKNYLPGIYIIKIINNDKTYVKKHIVK